MNISIPRTDWDTYFMYIAHLVATRATCDRGPELLFDTGRHGVGAVLVCDRQIISTGYNGSPSGLDHCDDRGHLLVDGHCVRTVHSEQNALMQAARHGVSTQNSVLYTTASPCYDCAKLSIQAGIVRVVCGEQYLSRYGLSTQVGDLFNHAGVKFEYHPLSHERTQTFDQKR